MSRKKGKGEPRKAKPGRTAQEKAQRILAGKDQIAVAPISPEAPKRTTGDIFAKNIEEIRRGRAWLYDRLLDSPKVLELVVHATPSKLPTMSVKTESGEHKLMHSDKDPLKEAREHVSTVKLEEADYLIVLGFGLGYHVVEAVNRIPRGCPVFIIEQSPDIFKAAIHVHDFTPILAKPEVKIFVGTDLHEIMPALQEDFKKFKYHNIKIVIHPPSAALFPRYREVMDNLYRVLKIVQINVNTLRFFSRIWLKNNLRNLPAIVKSPGVKSLFGRFPNKPAILVSAGPSLDNNIDELKRAKGKAVLLCADTSLRPLLSRGIKPDFVLAIDAQPITYRHFAGLDVSGINLIGVTRLPPELIALFGDRVFLASDMNNIVWEQLEPYFEKLGLMGSGSTVAVLGFDLAREMACDPIIFVGQDFSYSYGRAYADGTMTSNDMLSQLNTYTTMDTLTALRQAGEQMIRTSDLSKREPLLDIHGRPTEMSDGMQGWLTWFILEIKRTKAKCINASEAGILTEGVEIMPLQEAIQTYCTGPVNVGRLALSERAGSGAKALKKAASRLASIRRELSSVLARAKAVSDNDRDTQTQVQLLLKERVAGQVCEPISAVIDWYKQRYKNEPRTNGVHLEAEAMAWACEFAIKHILASEALLDS
ncbi:motility associated factor glycosyltransferase family protein [bacterium]|nr:motility associated factor glycosyltransferase family protein [bacterium]